VSRLKRVVTVSIHSSTYTFVIGAIAAVYQSPSAVRSGRDVLGVVLRGTTAPIEVHGESGEIGHAREAIRVAMACFEQEKGSE